MKISAITIFPEYFQPLSLSLIGKARERGLIEFESVDLREFAVGSHRSVDDTPYGGGAGMVMRPDVWGEAIDETKKRSKSEIIDLIVLTPAGKRFTQNDAHELAQSQHLLFACGRYEGIDARVANYYESAPGFRCHSYSIGDFVLNGGEVAAMVMIEAIVRLLPGVLGNPDSLIDESHNLLGELEYPVFTRPQNWRDLEVPEVLLSGNHGEIERWRRENIARSDGK